MDIVYIPDGKLVKSTEDSYPERSHRPKVFFRKYPSIRIIFDSIKWYYNKTTLRHYPHHS